MNREKHYNEIKNLITSLKSDKPPPISPGTGNFEPEEEKKGDIGNFELENQGDNLNNFEENEEDKKSNKNDDKKKYRETGNFEPNESNNNDKSGNSFEEEEV